MNGSLSSLFLNSVFTGNIALAGFLGLCPFLALSRRPALAAAMGGSVTFVMTVTAVLNWLLMRYFLIPYRLEYMQILAFMLVIAALTQVLELVLDRFSPRVFAAFGVFLPLVAVNCAILGVSLFSSFREYGFAETLVYALGSGIGWTLAILLMGGLRRHLIFCRPPAALGPVGIVMTLASLMALAFGCLTGVGG
ncbi:NADH:ubiquinone reductase (Na(+)-transporting) subunit E [Candidatus Ozemobacteraceae bacterium]|nr:NADH:ubiquinone reductase (Na(+)-transporting) subunit E [Candidatus Ozemobacteraceae bacterium]